MSERTAELRAVLFKSGHRCHGQLYVNDGDSEYSDSDLGFGGDVEVAHEWNPKTKLICGSFLFVSEACGHYDHPSGPDERTTWRWENPDDPVEDITLSPSVGVGRHQSGSWDWHFFVRGGEVEHV